jgi:ParB-like chromosome segregation protein Spo0J
MTLQTTETARQRLRLAPATEISIPPFHPLADLFPLMEGEEFDELVGDIRRRGLRFPITTFDDQIIDGRNRARACQKAGVQPTYVTFEGAPEDVPRFIISANIHRRHLKPEQRRDLIKRLLNMNPEQSDRTIATLTKTSPTTVGAVRRKATVQSGQLRKRIGRDGKSRKQPVHEQAPAVDATEKSALEIWGRKGPVARFNDCISSVEVRCELNAEMKIPALNREQRADALARIAGAIASLKKFKQRLEDGATTRSQPSSKAVKQAIEQAARPT